MVKACGSIVTKFKKYSSVSGSAVNKTGEPASRRATKCFRSQESNHLLNATGERPSRFR